MKTTQKEKSVKIPLTDVEQQHMKMVEEARVHSAYKKMPSRDDILREAVDLAISKKLK